MEDNVYFKSDQKPVPYRKILVYLSDVLINPHIGTYSRIFDNFVLDGINPENGVSWKKVLLWRYLNEK